MSKKTKNPRAKIVSGRECRCGLVKADELSSHSMHYDGTEIVWTKLVCSCRQVRTKKTEKKVA